MRHIFVVNPNAGRVDRTKEIENRLAKYGKDVDYEIYITKCKSDGMTFVKNYLETHPEDQTYRFYACGGDGSLYDVVNGAVGHKNAQVACLAYGSGNDFVKNFSNIESFRDFDAVFNGTAQDIDLIRIDDKYCINITSYGFDAEVTAAQVKYKHWPGVTGPMAYRLAAISSLLSHMNNHIKIEIDGEEVMDERMLQAIIANGEYYGGGMHCAPYACLCDHKIDFVLVRKIGKIEAASFMKIFAEGKHLESPKTKNKIEFIRGKKAVMTSHKNKPIAYQIDGEVFRSPRIEIELMDNYLTFVMPRGLTYPRSDQLNPCTEQH